MSHGVFCLLFVRKIKHLWKGSTVSCCASGSRGRAVPSLLNSRTNLNIPPACPEAFSLPGTSSTLKARVAQGTEGFPEPTPPQDSQGQVSTFVKDGRLAWAEEEFSYSDGAEVAASDNTSSLNMFLRFFLWIFFSSFGHSTACLVARSLPAQSMASEKHKHRALKCSIMLHSVKEGFPSRRDFGFLNSGNSTYWQDMARGSPAQPKTALGRAFLEASLWGSYQMPPEAALLITKTHWVLSAQCSSYSLHASGKRELERKILLLCFWRCSFAHRYLFIHGLGCICNWLVN